MAIISQPVSHHWRHHYHVCMGSFELLLPFASHLVFSLPASSHCTLQRCSVGLGACLGNYNCHSGEHNRTLLYLMSSRTGQDRTYQKEDVGISLRALGGRFKHHRLHYCLPMDREWPCSPQATSSSTTLHTHSGDECKWWHFKRTHNATFINTLHLSAGKSRLPGRPALCSHIVSVVVGWLLSTPGRSLWYPDPDPNMRQLLVTGRVAN